MASADDVAAAVLEQTGRIDTWKLQKLVYYCQAWHTVWEGEPLFEERIEAWAAGPVCRALYEHHRGQYWVQTWPKGKASHLTTAEAETVDAIVSSYGKLSGRQLSRLTHDEAPWLEARAGLALSERGDREITPQAMAGFYSAIEADQNAQNVSDYTRRMHTVSIAPGTEVNALNAFGQWNRRIALTPITDGHDFKVIWVCTRQEWDAAQAEHRQPQGAPWPAEDVRPA